MLKNTTSSYGYITKLFHWLMALMFIAMFTVAYIMINISKSDFRYSLYDFHKATGLLLFGLVALRLSWRAINVQPTLATSVPRWQHQAARWNIAALYLLMFAMPITGFLTSTLGGHDISFYTIFTIAPLAQNKSLSEFFSQAHEILFYLLIIAFTFHVIGSFYHHYFLKDDVLKRMWLSSKQCKEG
jgi:cytochrome b561